MTSLTTLDAKTIGLLARAALDRSCSATVLARFERSFCLDVGDELITIADHGLYDGPLNARLGTQGSAGLIAMLDIVPGEHWAVSPHGLDRGDGLTIDLSTAVVWAPERPSSSADREHVRTGLGALRRLLSDRDLPSEGLIELVLEAGPPRSATERMASPRIDALKADLPRWLANEPADPAPACELLGLGPGLTPSGDDLLAGLLITWHHLGAASTADRLGRVLLAAAVERTTPISQAHLRAAAKGYGAAPLHRLLGALVNADRRAIPEGLDAAAKIGHSSGLDAIAGMILALNAWLRFGRQAKGVA